MFNPPPSDLHGRDPLIYTSSRSDSWFRGYQTGREPVYFGKNRVHRWDAPRGQYGVLYLGIDAYCTFMESIGRGALRTRFVPAIQLKQSRLCRVGFTKDLRLIDFVASGGLTRLGAEGSLASGAGYQNSQRWSEALRAHPAQPDGLYYRSRYDPARVAAALFDTCARYVRVLEDLGSWPDQPRLLGEILDHYGFGTDL